MNGEGVLLGSLFVMFCWFAPHLFITYCLWFTQVTKLPVDVSVGVASIVFVAIILASFSILFWFAPDDKEVKK